MISPIYRPASVYPGNAQKRIPEKFPRTVEHKQPFYMSPGLNLSPWTPEENAQLVEKFEVYGPQWSILKSFFINRSAINVKNHWTTLISQDCCQAWESHLFTPSGTRATAIPILAKFLANEIRQSHFIDLQPSS
jgi:hypothetical protein